MWLGLIVLGLLGNLDDPAWTIVETGQVARFRGLTAIDDGSVFTSGTAGTILRSADFGKTWSRLEVIDGKTLDFRDIEALGRQTVVAMSAGPGASSRIYRTVDNGASWTLAFQQSDSKGFLDAIAFFNPTTGLALGDPLDGRFQILRTEDGGATWQPIAPNAIPQAFPNEGGFAASGTCLVTQAAGHAWFATGGAEVSRVFRSDDFGTTWSVAETPIPAGLPTRGIFSLGFADADNGFAIGGDYKIPNDPKSHLATTRDGGKTWNLVETGPKGYREALRVVPGREGKVVAAAGPAGTEISLDGGRTWSKPVGEGFHTLGTFQREGTPWLIAAGDDGRIALKRVEVSVRP